jgi:hypothetical protein
LMETLQFKRGESLDQDTVLAEGIFCKDCGLIHFESMRSAAKPGPVASVTLPTWFRLGDRFC